MRKLIAEWWEIWCTKPGAERMIPAMEYAWGKIPSKQEALRLLAKQSNRFFKVKHVKRWRGKDVAPAKRKTRH
jgi:hypothetical protein